MVHSMQNGNCSRVLHSRLQSKKASLVLFKHDIYQIALTLVRHLYLLFYLSSIMARRLDSSIRRAVSVCPSILG